MSFQIMLQTNRSNPNVVDKDVVDVNYGTGTFRDEVSITDPVVLCQSDLATDAISRINYAKIEELGRYYYVTKIVAVTNKLWEFTMHVDVLMSYRDQIRQQSAIVSRCANHYNMHLDDGWLMTYSNPHIYTRRFKDSSGNPVNPFESQEYVLAVAGNS